MVGNACPHLEPSFNDGHLGEAFHPPTGKAMILISPPVVLNLFP